MTRQPEVFVRELDPTEAQRLVKITRTARDRVRLRRAGIVVASVQGRSAADAAAMFAATARYAREMIHAFNEKEVLKGIDLDVRSTSAAVTPIRIVATAVIAGSTPNWTESKISFGSVTSPGAGPAEEVAGPQRRASTP
ncbi:hypothetical protein [Pseudonocardia sp. MH-G8]|uniref:hypothetical protein n=1 Tax=Pseudonocardia sp. MH-G8 TaxID=1854588 RepID=UPI001E59EBED|nr:hypothetical protein [Pseudonocardia sp. MH-G8]